MLEDITSVDLFCTVECSFATARYMDDTYKEVRIWYMYKYILVKVRGVLKVNKYFYNFKMLPRNRKDFSTIVMYDTFNL